MGGSIHYLLIVFCPFIHDRSLVFASSEEEDMAVGMIVDKLLDNFFHQLYGINLAFVGSKRSDAYPRFGYVLVFQTDNAVASSENFLWQAGEIAFSFAEDGCEFHLDGIA